LDTAEDLLPIVPGRLPEVHAELKQRRRQKLKVLRAVCGCSSESDGDSETKQDDPSNIAGSSLDDEQVPSRVPTLATIVARAISVYQYDSDSYHPEGPLDARVG
jgi:hypothetical protein